MSKFLRYWLPVLAWAALISFFSTDTFHGDRTRGIVRSVLLFFLPDLNPETVELVHAVVRKLAHMAEYCIFTLILYRGFRQDAPNSRRWRWALPALLVAVGFAGVDEFHQTFEPRRTGSIIDVSIDAMGVLIAQVVLVWHQRCRNVEQFRR